MSTPVFFCAFRFGYTEAIIYTVNYSSKLKSLKENIYLKYKKFPINDEFSYIYRNKLKIILIGRI